PRRGPCADRLADDVLRNLLSRRPLLLLRAGRSEPGDPALDEDATGTGSATPGAARKTMNTKLAVEERSQHRTTTETDKYGNVIDPIVRYARGSILQGTDEEVRRMLRARHLVGALVRSKGTESIYDLSGMNRGSGITLEDVPHLTTHVPFFAYFEGKTEPLALRHMGADRSRHGALILNRVSAANFIALATLVGKGDRVYAFAP